MTDARHPRAGRAPDGYCTAADGVRVASYDLGGHGTPLLMAHATGLCAAMFGPLAHSLGERFHSTALDLRAHGRSGTSPSWDFDWHGFALDLLAVVDGAGLGRPVGFGHSCGGGALLLAEEARPGTFAGLYLFEPVVYPGDVPLAPVHEGNPMSSAALRRRASFASRDEALANFSSKAPLDRLHPDALAAYVDNGFGPDEAGGISLRCRREDEAAVFAHGFSHDAYARLGEVGCPVTLASGSATDSFGTDSMSALAARLPRVEVVELGGLGHFGPLEDPDAVAASVASSLAAGDGTPTS